eukprot:gnl/Spiro4/4092_TR2038_c0_g9_i1.p1 gnl/Spiro4/4092_TR2038_c0_g9~~gnl/Spiro4/4092_TR2038_c0_g9_i1.p1  ORF type:complete len:151 (+),score=27.01 gnl/Spiro4/4092_TR2038_c0_g9_i1:49-453(+)
MSTLGTQLSSTQFATVAQGQPIYEVHVAIPKTADVAAYHHYMTSNHIPAILSTGNFFDIKMHLSSAASFGVAQPELDDFVAYKTSYFAKSAQHLQQYLTVDAPALRADFVAHCPAGARITRQVWNVCEEWKQEH